MPPFAPFGYKGINDPASITDTLNATSASRFAYRRQAFTQERYLGKRPSQALEETSKDEGLCAEFTSAPCKPRADLGMRIKIAIAFSLLKQ